MVGSTGSLIYRIIEMDVLEKKRMKGRKIVATRKGKRLCTEDIGFKDAGLLRYSGRQWSGVAMNSK